MPSFEYTLRRNLREIRRSFYAQQRQALLLVKPSVAASPEVWRCPWCLRDPVYVQYHDTEWGKLCTDDRKLFECIVLETSQAGLSWLTVLKKRENYREAFAGFDPVKVAKFTEADVDRMVTNPGIIRSRAKIKAAINNAKVFLSISKEFDGFSNYLFSFLPDRKPIHNSVNRLIEIPAHTPISDRLAVDLKKRGMKFIGSIICYAHLQATGYINDHLNKCSFKNS